MKETQSSISYLNRVVQDGLCHRCGTCVGVCADKALGLNENDFPVVINRSACNECGLCERCCPGAGAEFDQWSQAVFDAPAAPLELCGNFKAAYLAFAADCALRQRGTSGAAVTALLLYLLEAGKIDGALVVRADKNVPWRGEPFIARTRDEIVSAAKSKYAVTSANAAFEEIRRVDGRYAIVGLPCHIHGFHKAARADQQIAERVVLTIGLLCHSALEPEALQVVWKLLGHKSEQIKEFHYRHGKHSGIPWIVWRDNSQSQAFFSYMEKYRPDASRMLSVIFRFYAQRRCLACPDAMAEYADISAGDPWMPSPDPSIDFKDGYSFVLCRTTRGEQVFQSALAGGTLQAVPLERSSAILCNRVMATEKKRRSRKLLQLLKLLNRPAPDYGTKLVWVSRTESWQAGLSLARYSLCFLPIGRSLILRTLLSPVGYAFFWLNDKRRAFSDWLQKKSAPAAKP